MFRDVFKNNEIVSLELKGIDFNHGEKPFLKDISFKLEGAQTLALIGPNGSGKTTLLRLIAGLNHPSKGEILINGIPMSRLSAQERACRIAFVNQISNVDDRISLKQYVALGRLPYEKSESASKNREVVQTAMALTNIETLASRPFGQISGGERQRAHIARAICQTPEILILDEPTNHMDPGVKGMILSVVKELRIMVISSLHDIDLAPQFAEKIVVLKAGKQVGFGCSQETLTPELVRSVFNIEMLTFNHPNVNRVLYHLDVKIRKGVSEQKVKECGWRVQRVGRMINESIK